MRLIEVLCLLLLVGCGGGSGGSDGNGGVGSLPDLGIGDGGSEPDPGPGPDPDPEPEPAPDPTHDPADPIISFESASVRPMALAANGQALYVANTPNSTLDVFAVANNGDLSFQRSIPVGLEPVAVALNSNGNEAWVVNHLSDSISIVDLTSHTVVKTLLVGDEPRDIVFAQGRAFVTAARRGHQRMNPALSDVEGAGDPQLHTSSVPRADIWVFDADNAGSSLGGKPEKIVELFGDTPRALAVSADGNTVYTAVFNSGNQTTAVHEAVMCYGFDDDENGRYACGTKDRVRSPNGMLFGRLPGGRAAPGKNRDGVEQPWTAMIVKFDRDSGEWRDSKGRNFSNGVRFFLPDLDVFAINATSLEQSAEYAHVGTTLFNMAVNPVNGHVYVSNTDANNHTRFEGPGEWGGSTVQGNIAPSQITVIKPASGAVNARRLNRHIDYGQLKAADNVAEHSVALPTEMAVSDNGEWLYVAALGSNKVAVYPTADLDNNALWDEQGEEFDATAASARHINVDGGPAGVLLNGSSLYALTRFDNSVVRVNLDNGETTQRLAMNNPEAAAVIAGRPMLYDAKRSSSNGESACASCHIFGDVDHLAWNLGNPDASNSENPQPFPTEKFSDLGCDFVGPVEPSCVARQYVNGNGDLKTFASMKGPMTTQTMRGMSTHGHLHWRGDRSNGYFGVDTEQTLDERMSFKNFIVAFEGLLGLDIDLPASSEAENKSADVQQLESDMERFADFMLAVQMPPNPMRALDRSFSASAQHGANFFDGPRRSDGLANDSNQNGPEADGATCSGCHTHNPAEGFYGTDGQVAHGGEVLVLKVPQLRNLYTRVGMFGLPDRPYFLPSHTKQHQGDQIRGFGFLHDGATDQLINFLRGGVFDDGQKGCELGTDLSHGCTFNVGNVGIPGETVRQGLVDFLMEFDSDLAPVVGQQITLSASTPSAEPRVDLLEQRAGIGFVSKVLGGQVAECDLVAHVTESGQARGYLYQPSTQQYLPDAANDAALSSAGMKALALSNPVTYTCTPPGTGARYALDRDGDGVLNRDE